MDFLLHLQLVSTNKYACAQLTDDDKTLSKTTERK